MLSVESQRLSLPVSSSAPTTRASAHRKEVRPVKVDAPKHQGGADVTLVPAWAGGGQGVEAGKGVGVAYRLASVGSSERGWGKGYRQVKVEVEPDHKGASLARAPELMSCHSSQPRGGSVLITTTALRPPLNRPVTYLNRCCLSMVRDVITRALRPVAYLCSSSCADTMSVEKGGSVRGGGGLDVGDNEEDAWFWRCVG